MNIRLDSGIYGRLESMEWFCACGEATVPTLPFDCHWLLNRGAALVSLNSETWLDVRTQAQGDLTGYLAKHHYNAYGGRWNSLAKESRVILDKNVASIISRALILKGMDEGLLPGIILDLNRAILEIAYREQFPKAPMFFERLLRVYEAGRLPCGWEGSLDYWPRGRVIAH